MIPNPAVEAFMQELGFHWNKELDLWIAPDNVLKEYVTPNQAVFFHAAQEKAAEQAQTNMRPLMAFKDGNDNPDGEWYVMYWDDVNQCWNRARYADILKEAAALTSKTTKEDA